MSLRFAGFAFPFALLFAVSCLGAQMVAIPAGCLPTSKGVDSTRCVAKFRMDSFEVSRAAFVSTMGERNFGYQCEDLCPAESIPWDEARSYCAKVGKRLPSENEWEWALRGGSITTWFCGNDSTCNIGKAWFNYHSGFRPHPSGELAPNGYGLYDMAGNVWEWTSSDYTPGRSDSKVIRGGCFTSAPLHLQSSYRGKALMGKRSNNLGFRCVQSVRSWVDRPDSLILKAGKGAASQWKFVHAGDSLQRFEARFTTAQQCVEKTRRLPPGMGACNVQGQYLVSDVNYFRNMTHEELKLFLQGF